MSSSSGPTNWGAYFKATLRPQPTENEKKQKMKNFHVNRNIKNSSPYEPISINYNMIRNEVYIRDLYNKMYNTIQAYDNGSFYSALHAATPIRMNIKDSTDQTTFKTITDIPALNPSGVFSFTYYKPTVSYKGIQKTEPEPIQGLIQKIVSYFEYNSLENNIRRIYLQGILKYLEITTEPVFENWKVAVYTDMYTIRYFQNLHEKIVSETVTDANDVLEYYHWFKLYSHPNAVILCVTMPNYSMNNAGEIVEYSVIRTSRFHAFQLFPNVPVFVRDADTLFSGYTDYLVFKNDIYPIRKEYDNDPVTYKQITFDIIIPETKKTFLYEWEATFYENFRTKNDGNLFCIGVNDTYKKTWHYDPITNKESLGIFAGFISSLGGIDEWTDGTLWDLSMKYIQAHIEMVPINTLEPNVVFINNIKYIKRNPDTYMANINVTNNIPNNEKNRLKNKVLPQLIVKKNQNYFTKNNKTKKIASNLYRRYYSNVKINTSYESLSNSMSYRTYIGKDEQTLIFAIIPQITKM